MSDKELEEYINKIEPNFNSHLEKGTIEMSNEYYNLLEEKMVRLINKNQELKSQLKGTTHCFDEEEHEKLKKQLEEWKQHLKCAKEMLDIQGQKGNYDYDEYMLGLYNGMEYIISLFETREPNYISGKDVKFTNNKTQQKEFIKYLEDEKDRLAREYSNIYEDSLGHTRLVNEDKFNEVNDILQKYRSIMGVSDEKEN